MCNWYRLKARPDELIDLRWLPRDTRVPDISSDFFPGMPVPVIRRHSDARQLDEMTWGFPAFNGGRPINNTRSEKAASSPFWKRHLENRCLFPITGAIEWQHRANLQTGKVQKIPHMISFRDAGIGAVAGIYGVGPGGACCSMMTCRANRLWSTIHNAKPDDPRMPCFLLDPESIATWLDPDRSYERALDLLQPLSDNADLLIAGPKDF
ncbi:MAG: SOS response-associated peptidase family protein [Planctomycetia bacterium]|nr:MAG: SOS response-associated peptidase family protein [Planctomycetia bacterium]